MYQIRSMLNKKIKEMNFFQTITLNQKVSSLKSKKLIITQVMKFDENTKWN